MNQNIKWNNATPLEVSPVMQRILTLMVKLGKQQEDARKKLENIKKQCGHPVQ